MKNKYFICFKPKGEFYAFLKSLSGNIEMLNPQIIPSYKEELLHVTLHKPIIGSYKKDLLKALNRLVRDYSKTRIILSGLGLFHDNIVVRIQPTYAVANLWVDVRKLVEQISNEKCNDDDMLHVTIFKKVPDIQNIKIFDLEKSIPLTGFEYPFEYVCLFEKVYGSNWVEIERLPLQIK